MNRCLGDAVWFELRDSREVEVWGMVWDGSNGFVGGIIWSETLKSGVSEAQWTIQGGSNGLLGRTRLV